MMQLSFCVKFDERLSQTYARLQSATKFIAMIVNNLVTSKAAAKLQLLFNKSFSEVGLLSI
jgi:hypothetical protein